MLKKWVYVSQSNISGVEASGILLNTVEMWRLRNESLEVTGALVFDGRRFAQLLEGTETSIGTLQYSIFRDHRHMNVTTVVSNTDATRMFHSWSLLYSSSSRFLGRILDKIELGRHRQESSALDRLSEMFRALSEDTPIR